MLPKRNIHELISILRKDCKRVLKMHAPGFPRPYYCSFLLKDTNWFNTWASSGSTYRRRSDHTRNVYCDIRVGSYRFDQVTDGGLLDNDDERFSYNYIRVPIDDKDHDGLRLGLWRLSEAKFREALSDFSDRKASGLSTVDSNKRFPSFTKAKAVRSIRYKRPQRVDEDRWVRFCKSASKWLSEFKQVSGNYVEFDSSRATQIFVNTEGSVVVQHSQIFSLFANMRKLTKEGIQIEQDVVYHASTLSDLPDMRTFKRACLRKYNRLCELIKARTVHSFSGPVLLYPQPAGLLFHEAIGHRLEGSRLLSSGEGQTFKGHVGRRVIGADVTVRDDPTLKKFEGWSCVGYFDYDDEGIPAQNTLLVENGVLKEFLSTRAGLKPRGHQSNGHARTRKHQRPISRMGVTIVEPGEEAYSLPELKEKLIELIRVQVPFGMIVYETTGGETDTTSYDFQAFAGEISYATLVYPSGREEVIKGVDFVGTPLAALGNIVAVGSDLELDNSYCGAESGFLPVSTISPAMLIKNLELQAKDEELVTPYILPKPRLSRRNRRK